MTQSDLAAALGVSPGSISAIESAKVRCIGKKMISKIQNFFSDSDPPDIPQSSPSGLSHKHLYYHTNKEIDGIITVLDRVGVVAVSDDFKDRVKKAAEALGCSEAEAASTIFLVEVKKIPNK